MDAKSISPYNGYLRLRVKELLNEADVTLYRACRRSGVSYPTIHRYMSSDEVKALSMPILFSFLTKGLQITPEELAERKIGEIFDLITF